MKVAFLFKCLPDNQCVLGRTERVVVFRYLIREIVLTMMAVAVVLLLVIMGSRIIRYMSAAASGDLPLTLVGRLVMYQMPGFLELILPLAFFLGILLAYGQLYMNSEMTVLRACGFSPMKVLGVSLWPGAFVAAIVAVCSLWLGPLGKQHISEALFEQQQHADFSVLSAGRFQSVGGRTVYAAGMSHGNSQLDDIFVAEPQHSQGSPSEVIIKANHAYQVHDEKTGTRYLVLANGERYVTEAGRADAERLTFDSYSAKMEDNLNAFEVSEMDAMPSAKLFGSHDRKSRAELQWRWALAIMVPILTLLAMSLSKVNPRHGRFGRILPAIILHIAYLSLLLTVKSLIGNGRWPGDVGMWPIHLGFLLLGIWLVRRSFGHKGSH